MTTQVPPPSPEGHILRIAREALGLSSPAVARAVGVSKAQLANIENGYQMRDGERAPVRGKSSTVARLAAHLGVVPEDLEKAGRDDAAEVLREILRRQARDAAADPSLTPECEFERRLLARLAREMPDLPDEARRIMLQAHRDIGHDDSCRSPAQDGQLEAGLAARSA